MSDSSCSADCCRDTGHYCIYQNGHVFVKLMAWKDRYAKTSQASGTVDAGIPSLSLGLDKVSDEQINTLRDLAEKQSGKNVYWARSSAQNRLLWWKSGATWNDYGWVWGLAVNGDLEVGVTASAVSPSSITFYSMSDLDTLSIPGEGQTGRFFVGKGNQDNWASCYPVFSPTGGTERCMNGGENYVYEDQDHGKLVDVEVFMMVLSSK